MSKKTVLVREFDRMRQYRVLLAIGLAIIIFSGWMLLGKKQANPTTVFWNMFDTSLSTASVTRNVKDQTEQSKADQSVQLIASPEFRTHNIVTLEQTSEQGTTKVVTETIGTPTADYARYNSIETSQKAPDGNAIDFSSVTGVWGKSDLAEGKSGYFNEGFLGLVPFANLEKPVREGLVNFIREKNVYETDTSTATSQKEDGRQAYIYKVKINPVPYIQMILEFAKQSGLGELPGLDPEQYKESTPLETEFIVDAKTFQLMKINYVATQKVETFTDYGKQQAFELPTETIPLEELQSKLQQLQ